MFEKFKRFGFVFLLCLGVFGTTAFAATAPNGVEYNYYVTSSEGGFTLYYNRLLLDLERETSYRFTGYGGCMVKGDTYQTYSGNFTVTFNKTDKLTTNDEEIEEYFPSSIVPPTIAPTVTEAIQRIIPDLSAQLKIFLPVGVIILSIMLGVSLVPRLVHLFL